MMRVSRVVVVLPVVVALAACVRNPMPAAPAAVPAVSVGAVVDGFSSEVSPPRWERRHVDVRTVGGVERAAASLPNEWRGLRVAEPVRCAPFEPADYLAGGPPFPRLRAGPDGYREPLGCSLFAGAADPAVRAGGVVSAAAAHDAGLCARPEARAAFAADPDNRLFLPLTAAAARHRMLARGNGEWLPSRNLCWYVGTQLRVRRRYGLSVSPWEARVFEAVLRSCSTVAPAPRCDVFRDRAW